jgi:ribose transport system ATP-binding protein
VGEAAFPDQAIRLNYCAADVSSYWARWRMSRAAEAEATREAINEYGVVAASDDALLSSLSGGNQQKVVLARWLTLKPRLLLLDEPTQGVDVGARGALHRFVQSAADAGAAVLVVSSDGRELMELCDRVIGLSKGRISGEAHGPQITPQRCIELSYGINHDVPHSLQETPR